MRPILFTVGSLAVYSWGFFLDLAVTAGVIVAIVEGRRRGLPAAEILNLSVLATLAGLAGARLLYVLAEWPVYRTEPWRAFSLLEGGLSLYGALLGGATAGYWYARRRGRPFLSYLDLMAPGAALGTAIGRIGCTLRGCCYGRPTEAAWGLFTPLAEGPRFPAQPLEAFLDLAIFVVLMLPAFRGPAAGPAARPSPPRSSPRSSPPRPATGHPVGRRFYTYLALYAVARFITEFFRDGQFLWGWLTVAQGFSLVVLAAALVGLGRL